MLFQNKFHLKKAFVPIIAAFLFLLLAQPAFAVFGVGDVVSDPGNTAVNAAGTAQETVATANTVQNIIKEYGLDSLAYSLSAFAGQKLGSVIVNKVTGSADQQGQPNFVSDFAQHFRQEAARQTRYFTDQLIQQYELGDNPFAKNIAYSLSGTFQNSIEEGGLPQFTLKETLGDTWDQFQYDATRGGWGGYVQLANPANTNLGADILAKEQLGKRIAEKAKFEKIKVDTGQGFLPDLDCEKEALMPNYSANNYVAGTGTDPVNPNQGQPLVLNPNVAGPSMPSGPALPGTGIPFVNQNPTGQNYNLEYNQQTQEQLEDQEDLQLFRDANRELFSAPCLIQNIKTPAKTLSGAVDISTKFAFDKLSDADEIGEIVGGIMLSFVSTLAKTGLSSLNVDITQKIKEIGGPEQANIPGQSFNSVPNRVVELGRELEPAIVNIQQELAFLQPTITELDLFPTAVTQLENCVPGPDSGFENRLDDVFGKQTDKLARFMERGDAARHENAGEAYDLAKSAKNVADRNVGMARLNRLWNIPGAPDMMAFGGLFSKKSSERQGTYDAVLDKQSALTTLNTVLTEVRSAAPVYPAGFSPAYTTEDWNNLSASAKDSSYAVAKTAMGITTTAFADEIKRDLVKEYTWKLWDQNGVDQSGTVTNQAFQDAKNKARARFAGLDTIMSNSRTVARAETTLQQAKSDNQKIAEFIHDCKLFKLAVQAGIDTRGELSTAIANNTLPTIQDGIAAANPSLANNFATAEVKNAIIIPPGAVSAPKQSILDLDCNANPADCPHSGYLGYTKAQELNGQPTNTQLGSQSDLYRRQITPATTLQMLMAQESQKIFLCEFPEALSSYRNKETGPLSPRGEAISCTNPDTKEWYTLTESEAFVRYYPKSL